MQDLGTASSRGTAGAMPPNMRRITLFLLTAIYGFGFIDRIVIALVAQQIKADFGVSDFEIGLLGGTAFAVINCIASLPLAALADRYPRKLVSSASLFVASFFTMVCGASANLLHMVGARIGMAAGSAGTEAPPHSMISDMYPAHQRASAISLFMLGVPIAAFFGSSIGGAIAQTHGWRATFYVMGGAGLVIALLSLVVMREPARATMIVQEKRMTLLEVLSILLGNPSMRHILIAVSIISLASFGINTFLPAFFSRIYNMGVGEAGLAFGALTGLASAIGTIAGGYGSEWLARRDQRWLVAAPGIGAMLGTPLFIFGLFQQNFSVAFAMMLTGSIFFYMAMGPAIAALHGMLDSHSRATGSALFLLIMYLVGQGFGPPLAGWLSDLISAWSFAAPDFATQCAGLAGQAPGSACAQAGASGVRYAIAALAIFYLWSGLHLLRAAYHRKDSLKSQS